MQVAASWLELGLARHQTANAKRNLCEVIWLNLLLDLNNDSTSTLSQLEIFAENDDFQDKNEVYLALLKGYFKSGHLKSAHQTLEKIDSVELSSIQQFRKDYYKGLLSLRAGRKKEANEIWKPLIKAQANEMIVHKLKKQLLEHYYEHSELSGLKH